MRSPWATKILFVTGWLLISAPLFAEESERLPVQLQLDPCVELSSLEVRRIVAIELDSLQVDGFRVELRAPEPGEVEHNVFASAQKQLPTSTPSDNVTRVTVQCSQATAVVEVNDPITGSPLRRHIELNRVADSARERTLAVAIVEALAASWVELERGLGPQAVQRATKRQDEVSTKTLVAALGVAPGIQAAPTVGGPTFRPSWSRRERARYEILVREAALTERLRSRTAKNHPTMPDVVLRLAQIHEDLASVIREEVRSLDEPITGAQRSGRSRRAKQLLAQQDAYEREEIEWRFKSIRGYQQLAAEFPQHKSRDEILFRQGMMLEELGQRASLCAQADTSVKVSPQERDLRQKASQAYQDLIRNHPASPFVMYAYFYFAENSFQEGEMESALRLYSQAAQDDTSNIFGFALYKRAWCHINLQQDREAVRDFVRVIGHAMAHPDSPQSEHLLRSARMELIAPYARIFGPGTAWASFSRWGGPMVVPMMEVLAQHYFDQGQWSESMAAYHSLIAHARRSDHLCLYQARLAEASRRVQPPADQVRELRRAVNVMNTFVTGDHPPDDKRQCQEEVAQLVIDVALSWHRETVGTDSAPGTGESTIMRLSSEAYQLALDSFTDLDSLELAGWNEESRPTLYRLRYWAAELLRSRGEWAACGPVFDSVVEMDAHGEYLSDAAYSAVLCYENRYRAERSDAEASPSLQPRDFSEGEHAILRALTRYVSRVSESDDLTRVKFRRAMIFYNANRYEEAAEVFRDVAFGSPSDELAPLAAQYYVDSLNSLSLLHEDRFDAFQQAIDDAVRRVLANEHLSSESEVRSHFISLRCELRWVRAQRYAQAGEYERCASLFLGLYRDSSEQCPRIGDHGYDEVLFNAAICLESDYRIGQAIHVRRRLIDDYGDHSPYAKAHGGPSPWAQRALHQIGENYLAIAAYTKAAQYYEDYARRYPSENDASGALRNATVIRLGLGQHKRALENSRLFEKNYGRRQARDTATVVEAVGSSYLHQKQWTEAVRHYRDFLRRYGKRAAIDERIAARVNLGFAMWHQQGKNLQRNRRRYGTGAAVQEFLKALALVDRGRPAQATTRERLARYQKLLGEDHETRRLIRMVNSVAKARFYVAEDAYEQFSSIDLPPFRPAPRLTPAVRNFWAEKLGRETARRWEQSLRTRSVSERQHHLAQVQFEHWTQQELLPWVERRREAQRRAENAFVQVVREDVPEWEIAAAARVGEMHCQMMQTLYNTPIPPLVREDEELLATYEQAIDERAQPFREAAIAAYAHCLREATANRWFNSWSQECERQLHALNPSEYPLADEFRAAPMHTGYFLAVPGLVSQLEQTSAEEVEHGSP